jgi:hypothetical protein
MLLLLATFLFFINDGAVLYKTFNKYFIVFSLIFFLLASFIFLNKSYKYGKYTSGVQRF